MTYNKLFIFYFFCLPSNITRNTRLVNFEAKGNKFNLAFLVYLNINYNFFIFKFYNILFLIDNMVNSLNFFFNIVHILCRTDINVLQNGL
jgi:hypothetical protein